MAIANKQGLKAMMNGNRTPVDILNKEVVQSIMDMQEDSKEGKSNNWVKYYIDRIKRETQKELRTWALRLMGHCA